MRVGLNGAVLLVSEAIADGEAADLIEAYGLAWSWDSSADPGGDRAEVAKNVLGRGTRAPRSGDPGAFSLDDLVVEVEEGEAFEALICRVSEHGLERTLSDGPSAEPGDHRPQ